MTGMAPVNLPFYVEERSRHGRVVRYVRRCGKRERIMPKPGDLDFIPAYQAALRRLDDKLRSDGVAPPRVRPPSPYAFPPKTLGWLIGRYLDESADFARMRPAGRRRRQTLLEALRAAHGDKGMIMATAAIEAGMAKRAAKPGAANNWLKSVKALYSWALKAKLITANPADPVRKIRVATDGYHTWSIEEAKAFVARHRPGSMAYLALMVLIFTGLRRGDACRFGRQHIRDGRIQFRTGKTGAELYTALGRPLAEAIALTPAASAGEDLAFLRSAKGRAFASGAAFGNWFKDRCAEAAIPHCTAHGVRKLATTIADEEGASEDQLNAMFTWINPNQSATYTKRANRLRLASDGFMMIAARLEQEGITERMERNHVAPSDPMPEGATKSTRKALK